jgi:pimeloyl-ACP methyl ester carboxylesterase
MPGLCHRPQGREVRRSNFLPGRAVTTVELVLSAARIDAMALETMNPARPVTAAERYRQAERALWRHYGLAPSERFVDLMEPSVRLRVVEVGAGDPIVFVPGTLVTGPAWGALVRELDGYRCVLVDRPGEGLSSPVVYPPGRYGATVSSLMRGLFDELRLDRATVIGHSIGTVWALRAALAMPSRVGRVVLLGGGPVVDEAEVPSFVARTASPFGAIMVRLPLSADRARSIMRDAGHGATLDAGGVPDELPNWMAAFVRDTRSMHHERAMIRTLVGGHRWKPGLTIDDRELGAIEPQVAWVVGSADPIGSIDLWKRVATRMRRAEVTIIDNAGHLPWLDDPATVADVIRSAMAAPDP